LSEARNFVLAPTLISLRFLPPVKMITDLNTLWIILFFTFPDCWFRCWVDYRLL